MTRQREDEIESLVIYKYDKVFKNYIADQCNSEDAFELGKIFGKMHDALVEELDKEVEK